MTFLQRTTHFLGQSIGSLLKVFRSPHKKQKLSPTLLEESNKTSKQIPSLDLVSDSYQAYREAAKSDAFLFGDYDGYKAFEDLDKEG